MDNPVQTECSTGLRNHTDRNYVVVQPTTFIFAVRVELLRSSLWGGSVTPCCVALARGYPC
ncbi:MAG: hypothetical protein LBL39_07795 [Planctomycetaceae bacterium]|jgi:hypothetical protein|nr:hypothetical protein [Planctomycetaceae bacterium]